MMAIRELNIAVARRMNLSITRQRKIVETLWEDFFSDPSQWIDSRSDKVDDRYPDFKHKKRKRSLWLNGTMNPPWVEAKLATMPPGTLELDCSSWNKRLVMYSKSGHHEKTINLFRQMQAEGMRLDKFAFVRILNACSALRNLEEGRCIHAQIKKNNLQSDVYVGSCLVDMYTKCGSIEDACKVFDEMPTRNVVSWNSMILGYVKCGKGQKALELSQQMHKQGVEPNPITFVGILNACASVRALDEGRRIHDQFLRSGLNLSNIFVNNSLIDMYTKCGSIDDAQSVFDKMSARSVVSWNSMILGYVKCGEGQKALELYQLMQQKKIEPKPATFVGVLSACASVAALEEGRSVHDQIIQSGYECDMFVGSSLIDMYAKCGSIKDAYRVFNKMPRHNVVSWNAMLGGYALHGQAEEALEHFDQMCQHGAEMNEITFTSLLSACGHGGLVDEGLHYFQSMGAVYGISATVEHYTCAIDLLGRTGRLHEAEQLIKMMPCEADAAVWLCLLGACRLHGNVEMGEWVANQVLELEPKLSAGYVLLSNIYAASDKSENSAIIKQEPPGKHVKKQLGRSWIEVDSVVHSFTTDDQKHSQLVEICAKLEWLSAQIKEAGYLPDTRLLLHEFNEEQEGYFGHHSEKLAIACGLINTPPRSPLRIFKDMPVCMDCHTAIKFIGLVVKRVIIVRDAKRFHHFENGNCSCRDYW